MKKHRETRNRLFIFLALVTLTNALFSQVTTATLSGIVKDSKGAGVPSATVTVEYPDAGIKQVLATRNDGRFTVPNLRVGGPYRVTVNHVGQKEVVTDNIF